MSQEKVNKYKESKKTRKEDVAREKKQKALRRVIAWVVGIVIVAALLVGVVVTIVNATKPAENTTNYVTDSFRLEDYAGINAEEE